MTDARVVGLAVYPVKSMAGVPVDALELDARGVVDDRRWSVRTADGRIGSGKTTRRFAAVPGLLTLRATQEAVVTPDGRSARFAEAGELVSAHCGQPLTLEEETDVTHFDDGPVSLLGTASVGAVEAALGADVDPARFRANLLLSTTAPFVEQALVGREVRIGTAVLAVTMASPRCVMVNAETADLPALPGHLATIGRVNDAELGVIARVVVPGTVRVGDLLEAGDGATP